MKVAHSWLREFVPTAPGPRETATALMRAGLPSASVVPFTSAYSDVVVGRVAAAARHPNADRLSLCTVEAGGDSFQVVCGAPNVRAGMKAPFARVGAKLPGGRILTAATIRGVASQGMLCSAVELGLGTAAEGIMELSGDLPSGEPFVPNPEDWVLDIEVTPNRGDALSIVGVARSLAAILGMEWKYPFVVSCPEEGPSSGGGWAVSIDDKSGCGLYTGRLLEGVKIGPSPEWMQKRLLACGLRPINNVVDITNYVLLELGHPLHAFDAAKVAGKRVAVRRAQAGETMRTLDGGERKLNPEVLVIADANWPVAVAGVMGGASSEIGEATTSVFLEAAWFDPIRVRRGSVALAMSTESSYRFERGVDPGGVVLASERAVRLMMDISGAQAASPLLCARGELPARPQIRVSASRSSSQLGVPVGSDDISGFCRAIGAEVKPGSAGEFLVTPPTWRLDIREEADLLEEFAILKGYDLIPATMPVLDAGPVPVPDGVRAAGLVSSALRGAGFTEAKTFSFMSAADFSVLGLEGADDDRFRRVALLNPMSEDQAFLRTTLIPGLLRAAAYNLAREAPGAMLFEMGHVFRGSGASPAPEEFLSLALVASGRQAKGVHDNDRARDLFDLKGALMAVSGALGVTLAWASGSARPFGVGECAIIRLGDAAAGSAGVVTRDVAEAFGLPPGTVAAELDLRVLFGVNVSVPAVSVLARHPAVRRDLALVVAREKTASELAGVIRLAGAPLLESAQVFDVYEGKQVAAGMKSLAFRLAFRSLERTLTEGEADEALKRIITALETESGAKPRVA